MNYLSDNITFLKKKIGKTQADIAFHVNKKATTISNWEQGVSEPDVEELLILSKLFGVTLDELLSVKLSDVHLNKDGETIEKVENVHLNVHRSVHPNGKKEAKPHTINLPVMAEDAPVYGSKLARIPLTNMAAAAGGGIYNHEHEENTEFMQLPTRFIKPGNTYLSVRVKGVSMAPTLQDGGYVIIRLLDKSEWAEMHDQRVFVVIDTDGKAYLKRVKNRFKNGFIVLRSDSPDQASYPSFNLEVKDIAFIWYVELYLSAKMPNIHDQFYSKLQLLEDRLDEMQGKLPKINRK